MSDVYKDIGLFFAGVGVVNAGGINDDNAFSVNRSFDNANIAGTRLKTLADFLVLRRDEVRELFWEAEPLVSTSTMSTRNVPLTFQRLTVRKCCAGSQ